MDCPKDIIEVRRNDDGTLDEIVAGDPRVGAGCGLFIHLEQMDTNRWWMGIYHKGFRQVVWLSAKGKITASSEMDDSPECAMDNSQTAEIEVTDEMIIAGLAALPYLASETLGTLSVESLVLEVYRAMRRLAPEGLPCRQATANKKGPDKAKSGPEGAAANEQHVAPTVNGLVRQ